MKMRYLPLPLAGLARIKREAEIARPSVAAHH